MVICRQNCAHLCCCVCVCEEAQCVVCGRWATNGENQTKINNLKITKSRIEYITLAFYYGNSGCWQRVCELVFYMTLARLSSCIVRQHRHHHHHHHRHVLNQLKSPLPVRATVASKYETTENDYDVIHISSATIEKKRVRGRRCLMLSLSLFLFLCMHDKRSVDCMAIGERGQIVSTAMSFSL